MANFVVGARWDPTADTPAFRVLPGTELYELRWKTKLRTFKLVLDKLEAATLLGELIHLEVPVPEDCAIVARNLNYRPT